YSTDGSQNWLQWLESNNPLVHCVFNHENLGFGVGNNSALRYCHGRYVLFLNTDTLLLEPLDKLLSAAAGLGKNCGAIGGRVLNLDRTIQYSCREEFTLSVLIASYTLSYLGIRSQGLRRQELQDWDHATPRDVATLSGCYLLIPRHLMNQLG